MNSDIHVIGDITQVSKFSHQRYGIDFYSIEVGIVRESGTVDYIPVVMTWKQDFELGERVEIYGSIRTANEWDEDRKKLKVFIYADDINYTKEKYENIVYILGNICKKNPIRETPGGKIIVDAIVAINRPYNKSDYIPCVFWEEDAERINLLEIGSEIEANGRLQSRKYEKKCVQYEVVELSISQIADI